MLQADWEACSLKLATWFAIVLILFAATWVFSCCIGPDRYIPCVKPRHFREPSQVSNFRGTSLVLSKLIRRGLRLGAANWMTGVPLQARIGFLSENTFIQTLVVDFNMSHDRDTFSEDRGPQLTMFLGSSLLIRLADWTGKSKSSGKSKVLAEQWGSWWSEKYRLLLMYLMIRSVPAARGR